MMKKRMKAAAAAAMALVMLGGALPAVPGGAELLNTPLTAHAAGSVTLDWETGVLTLSGAVTTEQICAYKDDYKVKSVVAAKDCVLPADCSWLFNREFHDEGGVNYGGWESLREIDLSGADTSAVTDMSYMFNGCEKLTSLKLGGFDTSNVTNMESMFGYCANLTSLDLSSFDTSNVTDMCALVGACYNLTSLDVSSFDTSNVTNMSYMFCNCDNLTSLDLSSFDTSNVTNMSYMFYSRNKLETIAVSDFWNTDAVTKSDYMFKGCTKLKGGAGTIYDESHVNKEYARIDGGSDTPGYLTDINSVNFIKGVSLALANRIGVMFYVKLNDQAKKIVLAGYPDEITVTDLTPIESGDYKGCVKLVYPVNVTEVNEKITLTLFDQDGKQLPLYNSSFVRTPDNTVQFSVRQYIEKAPQYYPNNEKAIALAKALDNYCMAACNYFCATKYKIAGIQDVTADSFSTFKAPLNGLKIALVLNSQTELRVYGIGTTENYTARNGQLPDLIYDAEGGYHKITGITPKKLANGEEYLINGKYVVVSPLTYGYYVMKNSDDEALKTVVRALFVYAKTALAY